MYGVPHAPKVNVALVNGNGPNAYSVFCPYYRVCLCCQGLPGAPGMKGEKGVPGIAGPRVRA